MSHASTTLGRYLKTDSSTGAGSPQCCGLEEISVSTRVSTPSPKEGYKITHTQNECGIQEDGGSHWEDVGRKDT